MKNNSICPVIKELERVYDALSKHFSVKAFRPLITIQTKGRQKNTLGWYGAKRWKLGKKQINEINICAESLNKNPIETLVHEMVHYHNSCKDVEDCNAHQYHNKHFKTRAESYGLNVEKDGRHGWSSTFISSKLRNILNTIKINKEIFKLYRQTQISIKAPTKLKKFGCGCTIVRCATDLEAKCLKCNNEICYGNWKYGQGRCLSCAKKGKLNPTKKLEVRQKISLNHADFSGKNNGMFGRLTHSKGSYYKGIYMRSSYEIKFAHFLDLSGIKWQYESKVFNLGDSTYRPDFYIPKWDLYIEIKGWWRNNARKKFNLFKKLYSELRIKVLMKPELEKIGIL